MDQVTTINELKKLIKDFTKERNWDISLDPKTISIYLSLEAAELLEKFVFVDNKQSKQTFVTQQGEIEDEIADVFYWIIQMCWIYNIDLATAVHKKMEDNAEKYPVCIDKQKDNFYS